MNCLALHLNLRLCRLCHQLALHSGLCLSRLRRPLLQLAARLLYLVAQALLQSTPLFSRHLRRQHAQGQVLNPHARHNTITWVSVKVPRGSLEDKSLVSIINCLKE